MRAVPHPQCGAEGSLARAFDDWGTCDTVRFHRFDRTPIAWRKVTPWSRRREECVRRAAFALLAGLALHDRAASDAQFVRVLPLVEPGAADERHLVRSGASWALRAAGRRSVSLSAAATAVAERLAARTEPAARSVGKEALRELAGPLVQRQLAARARRGQPARGERQ